MFRSRKAKWRKLENPAKIFPATSGIKDERVFRFSCELNEEIQGELLQEAVDQSMEQFSLFSCVMRKGLFWNYLEESDLKPVVRQEYKVPLSRIYVRDQKNLLFEVTYFGKRINLEVFHALSDGTGTMAFLRTIVYHYLMQAHPEQVKGPLSNLNLDMTDHQKAEDSFSKYCQQDKKKVKIPKYKAFQVPYRQLEPGQMAIIEGIMPVDKLLAVARGYKTTITVLLTAILFRAFAMEMSDRQKKQPVAFMIPVNLRQFFHSESVRNFFAWIDIGYDFSSEPDDLETLIAFVSDFFKKEITKERMAYRISDYMKLEQNMLLRVVPLDIKNLAMQLGNWSARRDNTAIFSNVGKIAMPKECSSYIRMFEVCTCTPHIELCSCSYENNMTMTFTSSFEDTTVFRNFFRMLTAMEIPVEIIARIP